MTSQQKRDASFALMLFSVVIVFLVCSVDYLVLDILSYLKIPYDSFWDKLGNFLLSLNSAVNFIIYCAFGKKFRKEFFLFLNEISGGRWYPDEVASTSKVYTNSAVSGRFIVVHRTYNNNQNQGMFLSAFYISYFFSIRIMRAILSIAGTDNTTISKEPKSAISQL